MPSTRHIISAALTKADYDLLRALTVSSFVLMAALDSADGELDFKKRMQFVSDAQEAILKDRLILPILTDWPMTVTRKAADGYRLDYLGYVFAGDLKLSA